MHDGTIDVATEKKLQSTAFYFDMLIPRWVAEMCTQNEIVSKHLFK